MQEYTKVLKISGSKI